LLFILEKEEIIILVLKIPIPNGRDLESDKSLFH
jgi:hypothetical protein